MQIDIIAPGRVKERYLRDAIDEYSKRLSRYCKLNIIEVADEKTPDHASEGVDRQIKAKEGERIAKHLKDGAFVIALAINGKQLSSEELAAKINDLGLRGTSHIQLGEPSCLLTPRRVQTPRRCDGRNTAHIEQAPHWNARSRKPPWRPSSERA